MERKLVDLMIQTPLYKTLDCTPIVSPLRVQDYMFMPVCPAIIHTNYRSQFKEQVCGT